MVQRSNYFRDYEFGRNVQHLNFPEHVRAFRGFFSERWSQKQKCRCKGGSSPSDGEDLAAGRASVTSRAARYTLLVPAGKKQRSLRETQAFERSLQPWTHDMKDDRLQLPSFHLYAASPSPQRAGRKQSPKMEDRQKMKPKLCAPQFQ